jgi:C_GCAxxG_C_C family probable redox protein
LLAVLRHLDLPDDRLDAAACFGGGMGQRDLCGLLTGGFMALGNAAGACYADRKQMKAAASKMSSEYWHWFSEHAPIHCRDLKPSYDREGYLRMKQRVAMKLESLIAEHAKPAIDRQPRECVEPTF